MIADLLIALEAVPRCSHARGSCGELAFAQTHSDPQVVRHRVAFGLASVEAHLFPKRSGQARVPVFLIVRAFGLTVVRRWIGRERCQ